MQKDLEKNGVRYLFQNVSEEKQRKLKENCEKNMRKIGFGIYVLDMMFRALKA